MCMPVVNANKSSTKNVWYINSLKFLLNIQITKMEEFRIW